MVTKTQFQIGGFQKLSLLDFPGKVAAIVFTNGCNMRCPFCHNYELVENAEENTELFEPEEVLEYLIKRKNVLDGLLITGGEPTIQPGLEQFIRDVREKTGLKIKLDTNGLNPDKLQNLIDKKLIDYIAMDIKNDFENYSEITGIRKINVDRIQKSIEIIKKSGVDYEFRTTIIKNYHNEKKIENILKIVGEDSNYYLQKFIVSENVPDKELVSYEDDELKKMVEKLSKKYPKIKLRGIQN